MKRLKALLLALVMIFVSVFGPFSSIQPAQAADGEITVRFHYLRSDGKYSDWNMWIWAPNIDGAAHQFTGNDDSGVYLDYKMDVSATSVSYIVRRGEWLEKDIDADRSIDLSAYVGGTVNVYLTSGVKDPKIDGKDAKTGRKVTATEVKEGRKQLTATLSSAPTGDVSKAFTITDIDKKSVEISYVKLDGKTATIDLAEALDPLGSYFITFEGITAEIKMPDHYSSAEFEDQYTYAGDDLGANWTKTATTFKVWAPAAKSVKVNLYKSGTKGTNDLIKSHDMTLGKNGVWEVKVDGDLNGTYYTYTAHVNGKDVESIDPYAKTAGVNGDRGMVIDLDSTDPEGWDQDKNPNPGISYTDAMIYELHVRDFSYEASSGVSAANRGKYLAFTEKGTKNSKGQSTGIDYLKDLGITHVHLLPTYDYATVDETKLDTDQFNWGYDPKNYNVPEGSYSTDPYDGAKRVNEYKQMVQSLHNAGISVVLDMVYNHVYDAGTFSMNVLTPGYFVRPNSNASGCGNDVASERSMVRKFIVESVLYWAKEYHIDGFRFDLVGLIDADTINQIVEEVHKIDSSIIFYGEGWTMDTKVTKKNVVMADQQNAAKTPGFAYFNDRMRDAIKGGTFDGKDPGYINGAAQNMVGKLTESLKAQPDWTKNPLQSVNYESCHDNYCLYDKLQMTCPNATDAELLAMNKLAAALVYTSQGIAFIHAGEEILRSKEMENGEFDHNSYRSSSSINSIKWDDISKTGNKEALEYYKGLIQFRKAHAALRMTKQADVNKYMTYIMDGNNSQNVVAFELKGDAPNEVSDGIVVAYNPSDSAAKVTLPSGTWTICINAEDAGITSLGTATGEISVPAKSCMALCKGDLGKVEDSTDKEEPTDKPEEPTDKPEEPSVSTGELTVRFHYQRPDKDYTEWNMWIWSTDDAGSGNKFTGDDDFGVYLDYKVKSDETKVNYIVRQSTATNEWAGKDVEADRSVDVTEYTSGTVHVYLTSGVEDPEIKYETLTDKPEEPTDKPEEPTDKPEEPTDKPEEPTDKPEEPTDKPEEPTDKPSTDDGIIVRFHYQRPDKDYDGWNMWIWSTDDAGSGNKFTGDDDFGVYLDYKVKSDETKVNYIVRQSTATNEWAGKDVEADRSVDVTEYTSGTVHVYLTSGVEDPEIKYEALTDKPEEPTDKPEEPTDKPEEPTDKPENPTDKPSTDDGIIVRFHYQRPDKDYDGWNMWIWTPSADGTANTFTGDDDFGKYLDYKMDMSSSKICYIVRKGEWEAKDVDADREIDLTKYISGMVHVYLTSGVATPEIDEKEALIGCKVKSTSVENSWKKIVASLSMVPDGDVSKSVEIKDADNNKVATTSITLSGTTVTIELKEALDPLGAYYIVFDGLTYKVTMPDYYSSPEFENDYTYTGDDLGANWTKTATTFKVWAPAAKSVKVNLYKSGTKGTDDLIKAHDMKLGTNGVWSVTVDGDLNGTYYTYTANVGGKDVESIDPYARTAGANGDRGMVIDLDSTDPEGWENDVNPNPGINYTDAIIYELHVRDFSYEASSGVSEANRGKYLAFTEKGTKNANGLKTGIDYLQDLGITHVHLLPTYDYATVDETKLDKDQFNWGYDPKNYNLPEGSYSTDPYNGAKRVNEYKQMVKALHDAGISVVQDMVYNHVYDAGTFSMNVLTPGYFVRPNSNASGCGNDVASERNMVRKFIVESVVYWAKEYHIDGFRFDLVGLIDTETINQIVEEVHKIDPSIIFYGEGWTMNSNVTKSNVSMANQSNSALTPGFAYFNDRMRDAIKGGTFEGKSPGYINGAAKGEASRLVASLKAQPDWTKNPLQSVNYESCHDNYCLYDKLQMTCPNATDAELLAMNKLAAALVYTSQGIAFIHAGEEILRSKELADGTFDHNSYRSPSTVNSIKWDDLSKADNKDALAYYKGLIAFRKEHAALRMTTTADVNKYMSFIEDGKGAQQVVAFQLSGDAPEEISDGIVVIYNPSDSVATVTLPSGTWKICVNEEKAGLDVLGRASGDVTVAAKSCMVLCQGETGGADAVVTDISDTKITLSKTTAAYTGKEIRPTVTVKDGSMKLTEGIDYVLTYKNNKAMGYASIIVAGKGAYTGTKTVKFKIVPQQVKSLKQPYYGTTQIKMTWAKQSGVDGYTVYRATSKNGSYKTMKAVTGTTYADTSVKTGSKYYYKVRAYKLVDGQKLYGAYSEAKSMVSKPSATTVSLTAAKKAIKIKWTKAYGSNGYEVYMATSRYGTYKRIKNSNSWTFSYTKSNLKSGQRYYFKIRSYKNTATGSKVYSGWSSVKAISAK